ncbi:MAG: chorismate synthase [Neisseriaceae bacterium]|nr:chorismate synthase [Neisseriaceae bacterium]
MSGNTFGKIFSITTFGESHGNAIGCIVDGCPPNLPLSVLDIQPDLDRRRPGTSKFVTQRREDDIVEILSGIFDGKTTGTPIALLIRNTDARSKDYSEIANAFRPGHADFTYWHKYGIRDYRGGGRSSARETAARVAAGAIAKKWLAEKFDTQIIAHVTQIGNKKIVFENESHINENPFFVANYSQVSELEEYLNEIRKQKDSIGARITITARNVPIGLGEPVFDKLDAEIAYAMMGINAVKGVEIGDGFDVVSQKGSEHNDEIDANGFLSNHAGGILGGISNGQDIRVSLAIKPTPSIAQDRKTIDEVGQEKMLSTHGRHDPCVGLRAVPIAEAMMALVLMDHALRNRAQCQESNLQAPF